MNNEKDLRIREVECQLQENKNKLKEKELSLKNSFKPAKLDPNNCPIFKPLVQNLVPSSNLKDKPDVMYQQAQNFLTKCPIAHRV